MNISRSIIINGHQKEVTSEQLSYSEIVNLAFAIPPNILSIFTITYAHGVEGAQGSLINGSTIQLENGMIFNVADTGNA